MIPIIKFRRISLKIFGKRGFASLLGTQQNSRSAESVGQATHSIATPSTRSAHGCGLKKRRGPVWTGGETNPRKSRYLHRSRNAVFDQGPLLGRKPLPNPRTNMDQ